MLWLSPLCRPGSMQNTRSMKLQREKIPIVVGFASIWIGVVFAIGDDADKPARVIIWRFYLVHIMSWMHRKSQFNKTCARIRHQAPLHRSVAGRMSHTHASHSFKCSLALADYRRMGKELLFFFAGIVISFPTFRINSIKHELYFFNECVGFERRRVDDVLLLCCVE